MRAAADADTRQVGSNVILAINRPLHSGRLAVIFPAENNDKSYLQNENTNAKTNEMWTLYVAGPARQYGVKTVVTVKTVTACMVTAEYDKINWEGFKKCVLSWRLKQRMLSATLIVSGIEFQIAGLATENALSLNSVLVLGKQE